MIHGGEGFRTDQSGGDVSDCHRETKMAADKMLSSGVCSVVIFSGFLIIVPSLIPVLS